jgi:hypothetical protein
MNNALIIILYFFKKVNGFKEQVEANECGEQKDEHEHSLHFCAMENANRMPVFDKAW